MTVLNYSINVDLTGILGAILVAVSCDCSTVLIAKEESVIAEELGRDDICTAAAVFQNGALFSRRHTR